LVRIVFGIGDHLEFLMRAATQTFIRMDLCVLGSSELMASFNILRPNY
jgi:hypothetical protein